MSQRPNSTGDEKLPTLSLAEARQVIWQGRSTEPRGPMGAMLDAGQLTVRDMRWAAERHYNPRVKAAARLLLTAQVAPTDSAPIPPEKTPTPPASANLIAPPFSLAVPPTEGVGQVSADSGNDPRFGPEVIVGSRYLQDQEQESTARVFFYAGFGLANLPWLGMLLLSPNLPTTFWNQSLAFLVFLGVLLAGLLIQHFARARRFIQGRVGEERVVEALRTILDSRWTIFRNLRLPDRKDDLDLVLVGPGGVWVVEVKAYRSPRRVQNGRWEHLGRGGRWAVSRDTPVGQVRSNAVRLRNFLQESGHDVRWVSPAVALARPQRVEHFREADPPVWLVPTLRQDLAALRERAVLTNDLRQAVVAVLAREAERQVAREEKS